MVSDPCNDDGAWTDETTTDSGDRVVARRLWVGRRDDVPAGSGRRRRALLRDQLIKAGRKAQEAADMTARDATNRLKGLAAGMRSAFSTAQVSDEVLVERVRSTLRRVAERLGAG